ncbi:rhomboid family intramembrane serine protease [Verrucomicrobia bacterium]|nr:rhomboid family intramembrane serine protease [Verrucomicrobiota bacterium]
MRKAGDFNEQKKALRFWNYLKAKGVDSSLEEDDGEWTVWVADEDDLQIATEEFNEFAETPDDQKFTTATPLQKPQKEEQDPKPKGPAQGFSEQNLRDRWQKRERSSGVLTMSLLITSVAVYLLSGMGTNKEILKGFYISLQSEGLTEVLNGQFWRLFTPIFLHFSPLHILFNMYWLHVLGSQIERLKGSKFFITFVLALALFSNLAQFFMSGPLFGGMSGVVYGLFGYVFIKCKFDPGDGFYIDSFTANIMFGWFALCFLGVFPSIANWAHAGGLLVGLAWGYGSALRWNRGKR